MGWGGVVVVSDRTTSAMPTRDADKPGPRTHDDVGPHNDHEGSARVVRQFRSKHRRPLPEVEQGELVTQVGGEHGEGGDEECGGQDGAEEEPNETGLHDVGVTLGKVPVHGLV